KGGLPDGHPGSGRSSAASCPGSGSDSSSIVFSGGTPACARRVLFRPGAGAAGGHAGAAGSLVAAAEWPAHLLLWLPIDAALGSGGRATLAGAQSAPGQAWRLCEEASADLERGLRLLTLPRTAEGHTLEGHRFSEWCAALAGVFWRVGQVYRELARRE